MKYTAFRLLGRISHVRDMCTISNIFYVRRVAVLVVRAIYGGRVIMAARCGRDLFERRGRFAVAHLGGSRDIAHWVNKSSRGRFAYSWQLRLESCGAARQHTNQHTRSNGNAYARKKTIRKRPNMIRARSPPAVTVISVPAESRELRGGEVVCCGVMHPDRAASLPDHLTLSAM